jgi:hypothetical protein
MSIIQGNAHTSAGGGYQIERSLRFNSADSAYLNRTPASAGNRKTWTWSSWVKRGALGSNRMIFNCDNGTTDATFGSISFLSSDSLNFGAYNLSWRVSTQVFRDPSAWYHIVVAFDTTQATAANRVKMYVNGVQITAFSTSNDPTLNTDYAINQAAVHNIGKTYGGFGYLDGYLTEVNFIDGQALTPSDFGETDSNTGVWKPKAYTGTYGTNGFFLKFADNSNTTAATLGKDSSGNGNNWTPNNFSVTAGAGNDSMVDSPTSYGTDTGAGGEVRGNYCTLNPLYGSTPTLANGNLDATTNNTTAYGTVSVTSGKWYWEILVGNASYIGVMDSTYIKPDGNWSSQAIAYVSSGNKYNGTGSAYGASYTTNDIIGVALDMDAGTIVFYKNGSSQGTAFSSGIAGKEFRPLVYSSTSGTQTANFGQRAFAYTAPSGFKALCTQNLPTPTIGATSTTQANDYFNVVLWTGANTSAGNSVTGVGFSPDFVWAKIRSQGYANLLYDRLRGTGGTAELSSNETSAEGGTSASERGYLNSFDSDGFSSVVGTNGDNLYFNQTSQTYVAWNWKANGAGSSNTAGTITSTVSANTTSGFSIVTGTLGAAGVQGTVGHGLGVAPSMILFKTRSGATYNWSVFHTSIATDTTKYLRLNDTSATLTYSTVWGAALPTSTVFGVTGDGCGSPSNPFVAYCFAAVAGYSAFGSYTGNGSSDGPMIFTGFRPRFILTKCTSTTSEWVMIDTARDTYNYATKYIYANASSAEASSFEILDVLSNGFKQRSAWSQNNTSGATYIYAAFAESPFKYSLAR